tara:strand:+ start:605 stop:874 length:270 start_codon:yes stop_codon:yes gene_type:complete
MPCYVTYRVQWSETGTILKNSELELFKEIAEELGIRYKLEKYPDHTYKVLTKGKSIKSAVEKMKARQIQKEARKRYNMVTKQVKVKVGN